MNQANYTFRNYKQSDFDRYARLKSEAEGLKPGGHRLSPQTIAENLSAPGYSSEQSIFVAELGDGIVGYIDMRIEIAIGRVILDCWVEPEHRRNGLATGLFEHALQRSSEMGVGIAQVNIAEDNEPARILLSGMGFSPVRKHLELRLDIDRIQIPDIDEADTACRPLQYSEEKLLARIQNLAFDGSWGYNPNTVEEIRHSLNRRSSSLEDIVLTCEGDRIIGYCWTGVTCEEGDGEKTGRILMVGVDPDYRGRGIGREILLAGVARLRRKGVDYVELTVDSENSVACNLYRSLGFETVAASLWYEKSVAQGTGA